MSNILDNSKILAKMLDEKERPTDPLTFSPETISSLAHEPKKLQDLVRELTIAGYQRNAISIVEQKVWCLFNDVARLLDISKHEEKNIEAPLKSIEHSIDYICKMRKSLPTNDFIESIINLRKDNGRGS